MMAKALKKCAPLARRGWAMYIERRARQVWVWSFSFGFDCAVSFAGRAVGGPRRSINPCFMLRQVAENVIQVKGFSHSSLLVHFGATKDVEVSPLPKLNSFVGCIIRDVPDEIQEQVGAFYRTVFAGVLRAGHGTLAAVISGQCHSNSGFPYLHVRSSKRSIGEFIRHIVRRSTLCLRNPQESAKGALGLFPKGLH